MIIGIVDYGLSNLTCVYSAVERLGHNPQFASKPVGIHSSDKIILPGVGAFGDAMTNLHERGLSDALEQAVCREGKPFLGICLGAQLICRNSDEHGYHRGLGWANALVRKFERDATKLRVPHTGWNNVQITQQVPLFTDVPDSSLFYYTHSHAIYPEDDRIVAATCTYGATFAAALHVNENIYATQFHPEKSQKHGLAVLANFLEYC